MQDKEGGTIAMAFMFVVFFTTQATRAGELTLDEALSRMEMANDTLGAARQAKSVTEHEKEAAFGLYLPKVEATALGNKEGVAEGRRALLSGKA